MPHPFDMQGSVISSEKVNELHFDIKCFYVFFNVVIASKIFSTCISICMRKGDSHMTWCFHPPFLAMLIDSHEMAYMGHSIKQFIGFVFANFECSYPMHKQKPNLGGDPQMLQQCFLSIQSNTCCAYIHENNGGVCNQFNSYGKPFALLC